MMRQSPWLSRATKVLSDDTGSTVPLTIFFGFLSLVLILLVMSATSLYVERKRLFTLADGAVLAGSEAFVLDEVRPTATGLRPDLERAKVAAVIKDYVAGAPKAEFDSLTIERSDVVDGQSALVTLSSLWHPPVVSLFVPGGLRIEVTTVSRSVFS
ncbi:MAG: Tad domain-containing protein [Rhodoglobus sp.]